MTEDNGVATGQEHPNTAIRKELARQLHGDGVEFGPGCHPLPLGPFVDTIRYCDAFTRSGFAEHFPEVGDQIRSFPDPIHFVLDFDKEPFVEVIGRQSLDFIVANHVLEHLVNPLRFLEQCHQLLRNEGILFVGQPDKRRMFDRDRKRTTLADVVSRYEQNQSILSEAKIIEYVNQVDQPEQMFTPQSEDFEQQVQWHRKRSLHVNVWLIDDLIELFLYQGRQLQIYWELIDGIMAEDEFLLLFRKAETPDVLDSYPGTLARLWNESQKLLWERQYLPRLEELQQLSVTLHRQLLVADERLRETQNFVRRLKSIARSLPGARWFERRFRRAGD